MQDARLEQLFERFRRHGDVPALGEVFDETAGELLRVAMGLVREPGEADDLLQETFLTAIERAGRYESGRRLVPWLLGILVHHARERRRLARRGLDAERLRRAEPERPEQHSSGAEVEREVERALGALSARERVVLEAYLKHGKGAAEIATELGGSPGAVRMQIHRGLERLRKALPAGLALGAAGGALSAQGLDGVRAAVLRAGETAAESLALGAGSAAGGLASKLGVAGVLVGKKTIVAAVVAAAFLALFFTWRGLEGRSESARASDAARVATGAGAESRAELDPAGVARVPPPAERVELGSAGLAGGLDPLVGGLRGRLVERDGTPVAGLSVALLEIEEQALFGGLRGGVSAPAPRVFVAGGTSGADGVFVLTGARPSGALQALGVDLGGERPSVRVVDVALVPGELAELGDVVLAPTALLRGRVVDEDGEPVAGARVRVGELTDFLLQFGLYELAAGGAVGELSSRDSHEEDELGEDGLALRFWLELPAWVGALEERLPFVTGLTDARGEFELESAPAARVTLLLDRPGRMTVAAKTVLLAPGSENDVGELELGPGRTLAGRVLDASGQPVAGAEVRGGRVAVARAPALFATSQRTDAEGRFRLTGISEEGRALVIARRDGSSAWRASFADEDEVELRLASEQELLVRVVDGEGNPVAAPTFDLRAGREATDLGVFAEGPRTVESQLRENGLWSLGQRASGPYLVGLRAQGFAPRVIPCELPLAAPLEVELARASTLTVRVVAAEDGAPLAGALVLVEWERERRGQLASVLTDADGRARIEVPEPGEPALWVRAEHARHAPRGARVTSLAETLTIPLGRGGTVVARAAPRAFEGERHMLVLEYRGTPERLELRFPLLAAFDAEGMARRAHLPAGTWKWQVLESLAQGEALGFLGEKEAPATLASGQFELGEGETYELTVGGPQPASDTGSGTGAVHGRVTIDGKPARGVDVFLSSLRAEGEYSQLNVVIENGFFRFEDVRAGLYDLFLVMRTEQGGAPTFSQLGSQQIELAEGEVREVALEYTTLGLEVEVVDEAGEPVEGAALTLWPAKAGGEATGGQALSDEDGRARMVLARAGDYRLTVSQASAGTSSSEIALERDTTIVVRLDRGVVCAGVARLAPGVKEPEGPIPLAIRAEGGQSYLTQVHLTLEDGQASFEVIGLRGGRYLVTAYLADSWLPEFAFELPEWGSTTLEWTLGLPPPEPPR